MTTETFDILLNYDTSKATASLGSFRAEALRGLQDLASKAAKLDILSGLTEESKKSGAALAELTSRADSLRGTLAGMTASVQLFAELSRQAKSAASEIAKIEKSAQSSEKNLSVLAESGKKLEAAAQAAYARVNELRSALNGLDSGDAAFKRISAALVDAEAKFNKTRAAISEHRSKVDELKETYDAVTARLDKLRAAQTQLTEALKNAKAGSDQYKALQTELSGVEKQFRNTTKEAGLQAAKIAALDAELKAAGIDTANFTAEQKRLAVALEASQKAAGSAAARQTLGVVGADEARAQIAKLTDAYNLLRTSGTATTQELAQAKIALIQKTQEATASTHTLGAAFQAVAVQAIAIAGSATLYVAALTAAIAANAQYEQGIARINSITNINKTQLDELGRGVQRLTQQIGIDAPTAFNALYNIVSSGISPSNSLTVLEASAKAAIAGVTDINTAAKIGVQVVNAYGLQVAQLPHVYDLLFQTVKDGVVTFEELAKELGTVLPVAKIAGVSLEEVSASMVVLTRSGLNAAEATTALQNLIRDLAAPGAEAQKTLLDLGITLNGFQGTIEQIAAKKIGPELLRSLVPDVRGQRALALFISQTGLLKDSITEATNSAGAAEAAFNKLKDTPEQEFKKFSAAIEVSRGNSGALLTEGLLPLLRGATSLIVAFNSLNPSVKGAVGALIAVGGALAISAAAAATITPLLPILAAHLAATGVGGTAAAVGVNLLKNSLTGFIPTVIAAVSGYALGEKFLETIPQAKALGDALGGTLAAIVVDAGHAFDYLKGAVTGNRKEMDAAIVGFKANSDEYDRLILRVGSAGDAIRNLTVEQHELRKAFELAQAAVAKTSATYATAFGALTQIVDEALTKVNLKVNQSVAQLQLLEKGFATATAASKGLFDDQQAATSRALDSITADYAIQFAKREITEKQFIEKTTAATVEANKQKLASFSVYSANAILIFEKEAETRRAIAEKNKEDLSIFDTQTRTAKIALLGELTQKYSEYIKSAKNDEKSLLDAVKNHQEELRKSRDTAEEQQRAIAVSGLGAVRERYSKLDEFEALLNKSALARAEGRSDLEVQYAQKALQLAGQLNSAVSDGEGRFISAERAKTTASVNTARAQALITDAFNRQIESGKEAAKQIEQTRSQAVGAAVDIGEKFNAVRKEQSAALPLKIEQDINQIDGVLAAFKARIAEQKPLLEVRLKVDQALEDATRLNLDIEKGQPKVKVDGDFEKLKTSTDAAIKALPSANLEFDPKKVDDGLRKLGEAITTLGNTGLQLQSNVDEIAKKIVALDQLSLSKKTLEIEVKYTTADGKQTSPPASNAGVGLSGFADGGIVNALTAASRPRVSSAITDSVRRFASGGFVGKVPGSGNTDSVFRVLQAGSFVLRKQAAAELLKSGGLTGAAAPSAVPRKLFGVAASGGSDNSFDGRIAELNAAEIFNRSEKMTRLFDAAFRLQEESIKKLRAVFPLGYVEPGAEAFSRSLAQPKVDRVRDEYSSAASTRNQVAADAATSSAITIAKGIATPARGLSFNDLKDFAEAQAADQAEGKARQAALNVGMSFADYLRYIDEQNKKENDAKGNQPTPTPPTKKADGGNVSGGANGLVPALLTPGELYFDPVAVASIGVDVLAAYNARNTPAALFRRYIDGGYVAPPTMSECAAPAVFEMERKTQEVMAHYDQSRINNNSNQTINAPITINAGSNVNERQLARLVADEIKAITRRSR